MRASHRSHECNARTNVYMTLIMSYQLAAISYQLSAFRLNLSQRLCCAGDCLLCGPPRCLRFLFALPRACERGLGLLHRGVLAAGVCGQLAFSSSRGTLGFTLLAFD